MVAKSAPRSDALIAPWVLKGALPLVTLLRNALPVIDGPAFAAYIREVLVPEIKPGTVVILDYLATHRNKEAAQALRDHGCWFRYLPPYSPDLRLGSARSGPKSATGGFLRRPSPPSNNRSRS